MITLSIIGVVAAMTIPNLMASHQKQTYVTGLKKAYSTLQNAIRMVPLAENCPSGDYECAGMFTDESITINETEVTDMFKKDLYIISKQFKTTKIGTASGNYEYSNCAEVSDFSGSGFQFQTPDGMCFTSSFGTPGEIEPIYVDINGNKGPNKPGRDIFHFFLVATPKDNIPSGTIFPAGSQLHAKYLDLDSIYWKNSNTCTPTSLNALTEYNLNIGCAARVLEEDAMKY